MRIISGTLKGIPLKRPSNLKLRPTTDFAKEGLFNILNNMIHFELIQVLDLFTGAGNIALEFFSRGSQSIVAVDFQAKHIEAIKPDILKFQINNLQLIKEDALKYLKQTNQKFDVIFADPPFDFDKTLDIHPIVFERQLLNPNGLLVIEHGHDKNFENLNYYLKTKNYGSVYFSFFINQV